MKFILLLIILSALPLNAKKYKPTSFVFPPFMATFGIHKITQTEINLFIRGIRIKSPQGISVTKLLSQDDPKTENDDDELSGYVVDSANNIFAYNPTFTSATIYGKKDKTATSLNQPHGVDSTPEGNVYIADTGNKRVALFFNDKGKVKYIDSFYGFKKPYDVSHNKKRDIYVTDKKANTIRIYDKNRKHIRTIRHARLKAPTGIEVIDSKDIWHYYKDSFIIVINNNGKELLKFSMTGQLKVFLDISKLLKKKVRLEYITADYYSQILVTDSHNGTIHKFDKDLNYITCFGRPGKKKYEFYQPRGIDIWRRYGQLFLTELTGGQYYWVGTDIKSFKCFRLGERLEVRFFLTEPSLVTLELYKKRKKIKTFFKGKRIYKYKNSYFFLLKNLNINFNKSLKKYKLKITAIPTYSARAIFKKELFTDIL